MEVITGLLSALIGILSPAGTLTEAALEAALNEQIHRAEVLAVRVDNRPAHNVLSGQLDGVRIAGRGVYPIPALRVALIDVETDAIDVDAGQLLGGEVSLQRPLQLVARVVVDVEDVNQALRSPAVAAVLRDIGIGAMGSAVAGTSTQNADLVDPQLAVVENTIRLQGTLREQASPLASGPSSDASARPVNELDIAAEFSLDLENGYQISINNPSLVANGVEFPVELLLPVIQGLNQQLDLRTFERQGITARLLKLEATPDTLEAIAFVRVEPSALP